ncbi:hypothetical protein M3Y94_00595700 [Aphelenchoides besseyi]|nr:hypothetical protein M3Y94_00595700 [Aphelenchoides besseyi]KAI6222173.1 hypothetical protein M3Y95_00956500 [Aphelenchoides besseyi]
MTSQYRHPEENDVLRNVFRAFGGLNDKLEKDVRDHLKNVYSTLTLCILTAVVGVFTNHLLSLHSFHLLLSLGMIGLTFALISTPHGRATEKKRLTYLFALSFLAGVTTGPLISYVAASDPSIVLNAYLITMIVFGSFTMSALYADSTKFLHLGGILSSSLLVLLISSFFARYAFVHSFVLYGGLIVNSLFILYDTQLICEKRRRGNNDYVLHAMELFIDFLNVFRYLLIILKERNDNQDRRRRRD